MLCLERGNWVKPIYWPQPLPDNLCDPNISCALKRVGEKIEKCIESDRNLLKPSLFLELENLYSSDSTLYKQ